MAENVVGGQTQPKERWLTAGQAADQFGVDIKAIQRWRKAGYIGYRRNPGPRGHYFYKESEIKALTDGAYVAPVGAK